MQVAWDSFLVSLFCIWLSSFPSTIYCVEETVLSPLYVLCSSVINCIYIWVYFWVLTSVSWSVCLFLSPCLTVLITVVLYWSVKSGSEIPPTLFFYLMIVLAIQVLYWYHTNLGIIYSRSMKYTIGILIEFTLNL